MKTLYTVLGVDPAATTESLTRAYLRLKSAYPAERVAADENARIQLQTIEQAHKTLANDQLRAMYDLRLAKAGMRVASPQEPDAVATGWLNTRNLIVIGVIVLLVSGMWFYHAREQTRMQKEIAERALRLAEEERKKQAELQEAAEARRQATFEAQRRRQDEARDAQLRRDAQNSWREAQTQSSVAYSQVRQEENTRLARERAEQNAKRQTQLDAERRVANDKRLLRDLCMQRYTGPTASVWLRQAAVDIASVRGGPAHRRPDRHMHMLCDDVAPYCARRHPCSPLPTTNC